MMFFSFLAASPAPFSPHTAVSCAYLFPCGSDDGKSKLRVHIAHAPSLFPKPHRCVSTSPDVRSVVFRSVAAKAVWRRDASIRRTCNGKQFVSALLRFRPQSNSQTTRDLFIICPKREIYILRCVRFGL